MGVSGLLNLLKSIQTPTHLRHFSGQTIGVDTYGWLHKGAIASAVDLAQGKPSTKYVDFAMHRVRMLVHFGVIPYLVFDGDRLPSKAATEQGRAERRRESRTAGLELLRLGRTTEAHNELQKSIDITPEMAGLLIEELKRNNIQYVVAPYEADSQLAYLEQKGIIDGILSEDSDLLIFGAKTLLTKLDQYGECIMIRQADYTACREVNLTGWTCADLRRMAILSGCDYLDGVHKMGVKTAYRLLRKCKTIQRVIQCAQLEGKFRFPPGYLDSFIQAEMTFLYQWVYCPTAKSLVNLNPPESEEQLAGITYIGEYVEPEMAIRVATGQVNPMTKRPIIVELPPNYKRPPPLPRDRSGKENTIIQTDKKIDSFFTPKPNRIPLAELDPNSFAPSQSQQRLLEQNSARSWSPVLPNTRATSTPQVRPSAHDNQQTRAIMSAPRSHKRQRLCAEDNESSADALFNAHEERSRFFSSKTPKNTASKIGNGPVKKAPKADINIWSDDSIDDAMATLPSFDSRAVQPKKPPKSRSGRLFAVFEDDKIPDRELEAKEIDASLKSFPPNDILDGIDAHESPFTAGLLAQTKTFRERYSLNMPPGASNAPSSTKSQTRHKARVTTEEPRKLVEPMTPPPSRPAKPLLSDADAHAGDNVATVEETPPLRKHVVAGAHLETQPVSSDTTPVAAPAPAMSLDILPPPRALHPKGSEDLLIVPDSDAETDASGGGPGSACVSEGDDSPPQLNLQKFAFGGLGSVARV